MKQSESKVLLNNNKQDGIMIKLVITKIA